MKSVKKCQKVSKTFNCQKTVKKMSRKGVKKHGKQKRI